MNNKNHHSDTLSPEIMEQYLNDELTPQERNRVERIMLNSDFDSEAMDGFEDYPAFNDLPDLENKINQKTERKKSGIPVWMKIAASVAVIGIAVTIVFNNSLFNNDKKEMIALNDAPQEEAEIEAADNSPIGNATTDEIQKYDEQEQVSEAKESEPTAEQESSHRNSVSVQKKAASPKKAAEEPAYAYKMEEAEADKDIMTEFAPPSLSTITNEDAISSKGYVDTSDTLILRQQDLRGRIAGENIKSSDQGRLKNPPTTDIIPYSKFKEDYPSLIKGKVTTEDGKPIAGASVVLSGTPIGAITDENGEYTIVAPDGFEQKALIFSSEGHTTQEITINDKESINVEMFEDFYAYADAEDEEVEVLGFARSKKSRITGLPYATPADGKDALENYLKENAKQLAQPMEGTVTIAFDVSKDGELSNFEVIKSLNADYDKEAIRLIKEGPAWSPASPNGIPTLDRVRVKVKFTSEQ
ncbi:energy transducer TonB [Fulvivirga ligni]|uniref:energy transducer TonB n=1 Tax=Fulvivirga ligni TaxID=2904246 RepID=UPI001F314D86|nr:TonB family protein [Fulvivirga ligni]UII22914.1 TonB family protein [Fulvivirga ligni]